MSRDENIIELGATDSAFVVRGDGSHDIFLEKQEDTDEISEAAYLVAGLSIAFVRQPEKLKEFVDQVFASVDGDE